MHFCNDMVFSTSAVHNFAHMYWAFIGRQAIALTRANTRRKVHLRVIDHSPSDIFPLVIVNVVISCYQIILVARPTQLACVVDRSRSELESPAFTWT